MWVVLGLSAIACLIPIFLPTGQRHDFTPLFILLPLVLLLAGMLLAPRRLSYHLEPDALVITRLSGQTRLPYAGMTAWQTAGHLGLKMGGMGLPGYYLFHADGLKGVLAASSATHGGVILQEGGKAHFLTPADPGAFLTDLVQRGVHLGRV